MASIRFLCPKCSLKLSVNSNDVQMYIICPDCHSRIRPWGSKLLDIKFQCPTCDQKMVIEAQAAGYTVKCPNCSNPVTVPSDPTTSFSPAPVFPTLETTHEQHQPAPTTGSSSSSLLTEEEITFLAGNPENKQP